MTNRQFIKPIVERKKRYENIYTPIFYKAIQRTKAPVLRVAKEHGVLTALTATRLITGEHFKAAAISLYTTIGPKEAKWLYKELNKTKDVKAGFGFDFNFFTDIVDFLNRKILDKLVTELTETTRNRIYRTIVDGTRDGDSYDEIIRRLEDTELDKSRARLIARTETNRAVNAGHDMGRKAYPYEVDKIWLSARDRRTRGADGEDKADHFHMNEQTVGEEEAFTDHRANVQLMYPGDSSLGAPAATIVNCRCNVRFNPKRDANGRLILRQGRVNIPMGSIPVPNIPAIPIKPGFVPATSIQEAEDWARTHLGLKDRIVFDRLKKGVDYSKFSVELANKTNKRLKELQDKYNLDTFSVSGDLNNSHAFGETNLFAKTLMVNTKKMNDLEAHVLELSNIKEGKFTQIDKDRKADMVITHEFGHLLASASRLKVKAIGDPVAKELLKDVKKIYNDYFKTATPEERLQTGSYAETNEDEFIAESFTQYELNPNPNRWAKRVMEWYNKNQAEIKRINYIKP